MMERGKGELGMKSVLDMVDGLAAATAGLADSAQVIGVVEHSARQTLDQFRGRQNGLGRARMFAEKSIGLDDPGMLALQVMISAFT